jgi:hypothetical protein
VFGNATAAGLAYGSGEKERAHQESVILRKVKVR